MIKYVNDKTHNLRYVFKNRKTGEVYFVVVMTLLFGEELQQALREDDERSRNASRDESVQEDEPVDAMNQMSLEERAGDESPAQEFHEAKTFSMLGADGH